MSSDHQNEPPANGNSEHEDQEEEFLPNEAVNENTPLVNRQDETQVTLKVSVLGSQSMCQLVNVSVSQYGSRRERERVNQC
jgi:hypothetical protein